MHTRISQPTRLLSVPAGVAERWDGYFGWFFYCHPHKEQAVR